MVHHVISVANNFQFPITYRYGRAWDFDPGFGLVIAGGRGQTGTGFSERVEMSEDFGETFGELPQLPDKRAYACLVIVDDTIFVAGGQFSKRTLYRGGNKCLYVLLSRI